MVEWFLVWQLYCSSELEHRRTICVSVGLWMNKTRFFHLHLGEKKGLGGLEVLEQLLLEVQGCGSIQ